MNGKFNIADQSNFRGNVARYAPFISIYTVAEIFSSVTDKNRD